jgi:hypothetical protein
VHQKTRKKPVDTRPKAIQIDLISKDAEPVAKKSDWRLDPPPDGPGTMPRDAYVVWRVLLAEGPMLGGGVERWMLKHKGWDVMATGRALLRAVGLPRWFRVVGEINAEGKPVRRFTAIRE